MNMQESTFGARKRKSPFSIKIIRTQLHLFIVLTTLIFSLNFFFCEVKAEENQHPPTLTKAAVSESSELFGSTLIFKIRYTDQDNEPPVEIYLVFDKKKYELKELDPDDKNFSDGKDYYVKHYFKKGNYLYYFFASDGKYNVTTTPQTIVVEDEIEWHFDIAVAISITALPVLLIIYYLKHLNENLKRLTEKISEASHLMEKERKKEGV
ncbi:MAG TPA: hypothetical protein EYP29_05935 [Thermoplasmata archaeon]|nr:hypothetical protein [Thermoplasmata archaeon]